VRSRTGRGHSQSGLSRHLFPQKHLAEKDQNRAGRLAIRDPSPWAIAAFYYWSIGRHGYVPLDWLGLIIYGMLGKWGWVFVWGFFGALFTFVGTWNLAVRILCGKSDDE